MSQSIPLAKVGSASSSSYAVRPIVWRNLTRASMKTTAAATPAAKLLALRRALPTYEGRGLARFAQLREALFAGIKAGHWKAGERLPTESALVAATPFSLGTVQRALRALVDAGIMTRQQMEALLVPEKFTQPL